MEQNLSGSSGILNAPRQKVQNSSPVKPKKFPEGGTTVGRALLGAEGENSKIPEEGALPSAVPVVESVALPLEEEDGSSASLHCLLCRRKFSTPSLLQRHEQFSELHKSNLEKQTRSLAP